jgi:pectate lyase
MEKLKVCFGLLLLLVFVVFSFGGMYDYLVFLSSPPGWASMNGGTTGGYGGTEVIVTNINDLQTQASSSGSKIIYVKGVMGDGVSTRIRVSSNKTIIGYYGSKIYGGFDIRNSSNVIIRNLIIQGPGAIDVNGVDCITVDGATNIWLDHLEVYDGQDGNIDIVNGSNYVTVSWCKFHYTTASVNHQFCNLVGNSDSKTSDRGKLKVTFIYNWWGQGVRERMPRVRFGQNHVVNNLYTCSGNNYCIRAGIEADIRVEWNIFKNVNTPIDLGNNNFTAVTVENNRFISVSGNTTGRGVAFSPPYTVSIIPLDELESYITTYAGATLPIGISSGTTYTLTVNINPSGAGSVTLNPSGGVYVAGTTVTLTAVANSGWVFSSWSG